MIRLKWIVLILANFSVWSEPSYDQSKIKQQSSVVAGRAGNRLIVKNKSNLKVSDLLLFVRPLNGNFDILARGKVSEVKKESVIVELDAISVAKQPLDGDLVISLSKPFTPTTQNFPEPPPPPVSIEDPGIPGDPGYFEAYGGVYDSSLKTEAPIPVNLSKQVGSYRFSNFKLAWFLEYFWRIGVEYERVEGVFPTSTYFRQRINSSLKYSRYGLTFRTRKIFNDHLRYSIQLNSLKEAFKTDNPDENLLSTTVDGYGIAHIIDWEFESPIWTSNKPYLDGRLQKLYASFTYFPSLSAVDGDVSRGLSSDGTTGSDYKLGLQAILYFKWIPVFKRWFFDLHLGQTTYELKFSGPTKSEVDGIYTIPENSKSKEIKNYYYIGFGFRFDDFISKFFKPK